MGCSVFGTEAARKRGEKMRGKPLTPEAQLTRSIRYVLKMAGCFHWKQWQGLGSFPGVSDILGIWQGKLLAIEIKAPKGNISDHQQVFIDRINAEGGLAFVARDIDTVIEKLGLQDRFLIR